ncbi:hypothetical protein [Planosporangium mesophilum]|nr:hypothetical protein [Planosporangium mesophilum]NJC82674.1 hypothetical protein [Planosporangium mesophilum]
MHHEQPEERVVEELLQPHQPPRVPRPGGEPDRRAAGDHRRQYADHPAR